MKNFYLEKSLGIDIRDDSICLTLLGKNFYRIDIIAAQYIQVKLLDIGSEKTDKCFLEKVNQFLIENNAWTENVVISIPRSKVTLQSFELPAPDRNSLDSIIKFEVEKHFSSDLENFLYSNHVSAKDSKQYHIGCAAIKKDVANHYLKLLEKLNLKASILDVSTFANVNMVWQNKKYSETLSVVLDLNLNFIEISILNNKIMEFSRNVSINDPEYREAFINSNTEQQKIENLLTKITNIIIEEIQNGLASCKNINDSTPVKQIHILGNAKIAKPLSSKLKAATGVNSSTIYLPEFINPSISNNFTTKFMPTSIGLALRALTESSIEINLLPSNKETTQIKRLNIKKTVGLAMATVLFAIGFIVNQYHHSNKILISLDKQLNELKTQVGPLEKVDLEYNSLQNYMTILNKIDQIHPIKLPLLIELSRIIPKDTWIKKIKLKKGKIEINGVSASASRLVPIVEKSNYFHDTRFIGTIVTESRGEKFTISSATGATQ